MAASASRPLHQPGRFGRLWWLPAAGLGNGLTDDAWAPVADVDEPVVLAVLAELRAAGVPGYAAPVTDRPGRSRHRGLPAATRPYHVWVGTSRYSRAEDVLRVRLPVLLGQAQPARSERGDQVRDQDGEEDVQQVQVDVTGLQRADDVGQPLDGRDHGAV
jgi:hypothetical protein